MRDEAEMNGVAGLETGALIERYARGVEQLDRRVLELEDEQLDTPFRAEAGVGLWPCRVLVGHVAEAELVLVGRVRRMLAEDRPMLSVLDEEAYIRAGLYGTPTTGKLFPVAGFVGMIHTTRKWHADLLRALTDEHWQRQGMDPEKGVQTVRSVMEYAVFHIEHHAAFLRLKLNAMLGEETEPDGKAIHLPIAKQ